MTDDIGNLAEKLKTRLVCNIVRVEGALGRIMANWQNCTHYDHCALRKLKDYLRILNKEKGRRTHCYFSFGMCECPAYQNFELQ